LEEGIQKSRRDAEEKEEKLMTKNLDKYKEEMQL
jgi:hypothetical protein